CEGRFQAINAEWLQLLRHQKDTLLGKLFAHFVDADESRRLERRFCGKTEDSLHEAFDARFQCGDGTYKWLHCESKWNERHRAFAVVARELSPTDQAQIVLQRRAAAALLRVNIWSSWASGGSTDDVVRRWEDLLRRDLQAADVLISRLANRACAL